VDPIVRSKLRAILKAPYAGTGASEESLRSLMAELEHRLPDEYLDFMRQTNGYTGEVGPSGFVCIWPVDDVVPTNKANNYREWIPGLVLFGSNESGDFYAFDVRQDPTTVVSVPAIVDLKYVKEISPSFVGFLECLAGA